jgi:cell fate regulator YaaT (PSP1 superfamily)
MVVVDSGNGYDVGRISLSGELVKLQMKKKRVNSDRSFNKVIRTANQRDLEKLEEARSLEKEAMVRARVIARTLGLDMKVGDVEFQGDKRKATFYYTAEGRVDFRELVRQYAKEFRVKIEMRQIGARQESSRIGGIGSCGRELCCSTWLTDFKSVSTTTARYQYMAINQSKLSGQCGRLKCCLNYELDSYLDALEHFPKRVDTLRLKNGRANLMKVDIFKGLMVYGIQFEVGRGPIVTLTNKQVFKIKEMIDKGDYPEDLTHFQEIPELEEHEKEPDFGDVTGVFELKETKKRSRNRNRKNRKPRSGGNPKNSGGPKNEQGPKQTSGDKPARKGAPRSNRRKPNNPNKKGPTSGTGDQAKS